MRSEDLLISAVVRGAGVRSAMRLGVTSDLFLRRKAEWIWLENHKTASKPLFRSRFPDFQIAKVDADEIQEIVEQVRINRADYELGKALEKIQQDLGKIPPAELAAKLESAAKRIINRWTTGADIDIIHDFEDIYQHVNQAKTARADGTTVGFPFGVPTLDRIFGGATAPDLISIVARQGEGKTWLSLYMGANALEAGAKVLYASLEMSAEQLGLRMHTLLSRKLAMTYKKRFKQVFANTGLMMGAVDMDEYRHFLVRMKKHFKTGFIVPNVKGGFSLGAMSAKVEQLGPDIAFFDYFGLAVGDSNKVENWIEARNASRTAKQCCLENNIPFVLNAQANRSAADSKDVPQLHQIGLTDSLGADSDRVLGLRLRRDELTVGVIKNRHGKQGMKLHLETDLDQGIIRELVIGRNRSEEE